MRALANQNFVRPFVWMVAAAALWATAFLAPVAAKSASPFEIVLARYAAYGLVSLVGLKGCRLSKFRTRDLAYALAFAAFGNVAFYYFLVIGMRSVSPSLAIPIVGLLPVTVSLAGNWSEPRLSLRRIALPLALILVGLAAIDMFTPPAGQRLGSGTSFLGVAALLSCLAMWTWFAVANSAYLKRRLDVTATEWASLTGVAALLLCAAMLSGYFVANRVAPSLAAARLYLAEGNGAIIVLWGMILGCGASWGSAVLFNKAVKVLPISIAGQLVVLETVFGIVYVWLAEVHLPNLGELTGIACAIGGIYFSIRALQTSVGKRENAAIRG